MQFSFFQKSKLKQKKNPEWENKIQIVGKDRMLPFAFATLPYL